MIAFFLGSHPDVSLAELRIVFGTKEALRLQTIVLFDISEELFAEKFHLLGGVPRSGSVVETFTKRPTTDELVAALRKSLEKVERREYVLSLFGVKVDKKTVHHDLKRSLTGVKYDGNFDEAQHSPAAVAHVIARGGKEYALLQTSNDILLIETLKVQDPKFWTVIDAERPGRDMKIGILPAKLARIMVNLTSALPGEVVWDPFIGQATIAMQAASIGIKTFGTDKSPMSIDKGKQNIEWLIQQKLAKRDMVSFAIQPIERAKANAVIAGIATEPYLGKARFKPFPSEMLAKREWKEIERLYKMLLQVAASILNKGQRIVLVKPMFAFIAKNQVEWYNPPLPMPSGSLKVPELLADLGPLLWQNRESVVGRQIVVLEKS
jgi:tRNA G10  N-methylase Trm11